MKIFLVFCGLLFSGVSFAGVVSQDPGKYALNDVYSGYSKAEILAPSSPEKDIKEYLLGLLYFYGNSQWGVEKSCKKGMSLLNSAWKSGVVDAGYALGVAYYKGDCVKKSLSISRDYFLKTAEAGYLRSQKVLGLAYLGKQWTELFDSGDLDKAVFWLGKAGDAGDRDSAGLLAAMYRKGDGVPKDECESFSWLKKAVFSRFGDGDTAGFPLLAKYYEKGMGTSVNLVEAYKYYDLSGSAGVDDKQRIAKEMTQEQIDEALRQSKEWQKEHNVQVGGGFIRRTN
ncbi:tetratricopeptide repeat protein [Salinicola sp. JS01]|uniref:tetratricopeptide repeat protein n=1 Tax=Salinicola sp. JS01 TaxID=3050071 RepID=UPI00255B707D|nr:tetratricopeptide repeat protein [Salinicola sp. JS01]WIX34212.1 tetratricopeptide repeat protein [Salinicola sp. JS01]